MSRAGAERQGPAHNAGVVAEGEQQRAMRLGACPHHELAQLHAPVAPRCLRRQRHLRRELHPAHASQMEHTTPLAIAMEE